MTIGLRLGAPGVYRTPERPGRALSGVRMDIAGFAGIAPRGPIDEPVPVSSWTDYRQRFGGFEGPGLLPYAVSAFFEQGGERAYVLRAGPGDPAGRALFELDGGARFTARDWGVWGSSLSARLEYAAGARFLAVPRGERVPLDAGVPLRPGTLLRVRGPGLGAYGELRRVREVERRTAVLDRPLPGPAEAEVVTATLVVDDGDRAFPRAERFTDLALTPEGRRHVAGVAEEESRLIIPVGDWRDQPLGPAGPLLAPRVARLVTAGADRYREIGRESFFDPGDELLLLDDPYEHRGVARLAAVPELGLLSVPDLFWAYTEEETEIEITGDPGPCAEPVLTAHRRPRPVAPLLEPADPEVAERQSRLVALAERHQRFITLLDVPSGLDVRAVARWRAPYGSAFAAAYHPWLMVQGQDGRGVPVPPSAFAAGIIAARERRRGLLWGPANEPALGAVLGLDQVTDHEHDLLYDQGVNVFRQERDGFRLTSARTLDTGREYRQLSVRRLLTMLRLSIERQAQFLVFEPNTAELRALLNDVLDTFLRGLFRAGAFAGETERESYFVRSGDELNPRESLELGRLVAEIGVAPAEPMEFLVLRLSRDGDGGVRVEEAPDGGA
ncbi:phage tail sheath family protein [Nonomuraea zeae]|uniref:phage tail sheath family protein n=1 Tax=Nonomuraea zeae TaxID=1642303 RepID=UPI001478F810|nr:phage tail sheath subtilisin-like domain-containing protein [Nonomuraea zeae]